MFLCPEKHKRVRHVLPDRKDMKLVMYRQQVSWDKHFGKLARKSHIPNTQTLVIRGEELSFLLTGTRTSCHTI